MDQAHSPLLAWMEKTPHPPPPALQQSLGILGAGPREHLCFQSPLVSQKCATVWDGGWEGGCLAGCADLDCHCWPGSLGRLCSLFSWKNRDRRTVSEGRHEKEKCGHAVGA